MGCTSSASNIPDVHTDNTGEDKSKSTTPTNNSPKHLNGDDEGDKINVLPTCDNLDESIQLARNNSYNSDQQVKLENDDHHSIVKNENTVPDIEEQETKEKEPEKKFPSLQEVVDKVILDNIFDHIADTSTDSEDKSNNDNKIVVAEMENNSEQNTEMQEKDDKEQSDETQEEEHPEESVSPSQSDCSRATRWEALADIAAELPASLAVDPLTGQIYSLAK